jgi:hypothetical protein
MTLTEEFVLDYDMQLRVSQQVRRMLLLKLYAF